MNTSEKSIWLLEDDPGNIFVYKDILELNNHLRVFDRLCSLIRSLREVRDGKLAPPDLLIADLIVGEKSFIDFLTSEESFELLTVPFVIVSSLDNLETLRLCFNEGATDYITKPFKKNELLVKIERLFTSPPALIVSQPFESDVVVFDPATLTLRKGSVVVHLTAKQMQIYAILDRAKGRPIPRSALEEEIWTDVIVSAKSLDVHIFHLRQKLKKLGLQISNTAEAGYSITPIANKPSKD